MVQQVEPQQFMTNRDGKVVGLGFIATAVGALASETLILGHPERFSLASHLLMTIGALVAIHGSAMFWGWPFKRFFWLQCAVFYPFAAWGIWVAFGIPLARCLGLFAMGIAGGTLFFYVGGRRLSGPYK